MEVPTQKQTPKEIAESVMVGRTSTFLIPSGYQITIRELNGDDEDILSNQSTVSDLSNLRIFISGITVETNLPMAIGGKLSVEAAGKLLLRDKYFILLMARKHSYGDIVKIPYDWGKSLGGEMIYEENLNRYIWDYSKPYPEEGEEHYDNQRIRPYPADAYDLQHLTLKSGKTLRYHFLDGASETELLQLPIGEQTRNTEIKARGLELDMDGKWVKVENFRFFTRQDLAELHKFFNINDTSFAGATELEHPKTKQIVYSSIMQSNDFFYPGEI